MASHSVTIDGGVGGNDPVQAAFFQRCGYKPDTLIVHIRRDLYRQRHIPACLCLAAGLLIFYGLHQAFQRVSELQVPQARRIGRRHVNRYVVRMGINRRDALPVIGFRLIVWRRFVFTDVDTQNPGVATVAYPLQQVPEPVIIEPHTVNQRFMLLEPEHTWLGIARLGERSDRAYFYKTKA